MHQVRRQLRRSYHIVPAGAFLALAVSCTPRAERLPIMERLMPSDYSRERTDAIDTIMVHFCSDVVANKGAPYSVERILRIFREYGVSVHYLIDRRGQVHRFVKEDRVAYHAGRGQLPWRRGYRDRLNEVSVGIELFAIGTREEMKAFMTPEEYGEIASEHIGFTDKQYESLIALIKDIVNRNPDIAADRCHVVGHDEYAPDRRPDPGSLFDWDRLQLRQGRCH